MQRVQMHLQARPQAGAHLIEIAVAVVVGVNTPTGLDLCNLWGGTACGACEGLD